MKIVFQDESSVDVLRVSKMRDFGSHESRLSVDVYPTTDIDELLEKDFSSITAERIGMPDVVFEGYVVSDVSESFEDHFTSVTVNLAKADQ